ncbi:flavodoxin family protein [Bacillus timonensis]|nr:flavodoxin family protein [Bacillus timonensis]
MNILVLYGSSRQNGNSEILTKAVINDIPHTEIFLRDLHIEPIEDKRHCPGGFQPVEDDYDGVIEKVIEHDIVIVATPLYWYGMSGIMKNFFDRWSQSLRDSRFSFKDEMSRKKGYVVITGGDHPRIKALPLVQQFQYIFDFVSMEFSDYILGKGSRPGEILQDERALFEANLLNGKLKELLKNE